jgi:hypothetical protein
MNEYLNLPPLRQPRKPVKVKPKMPDWVKQRYIEAHQKSFSQVVKDAGHTFKTTMPECNKANGLTQAIVKFLLWHGHRATRVSSSGRMIKGRYIPGTTRKGAADISATIKGRSVMFEIKIGADKPSEYQLREQELERKAGGIYEFVKTFEHFLNIYDDQTN